jgi:hypothetical protein
MSAIVRLDLALALLGRVIFGIFRQIAVGAGFLDRVDDLRPLDRFQVPDLGLELLIALGQHRHLIDRRHSHRLSSKNNSDAPAGGDRPFSQTVLVGNLSLQDLE